MEPIFSAVADPTRRLIPDRLRPHGPLSIKQLADPLPISRQAETKHLDILLLKESGFATEQSREENLGGWKHELGELVEFLGSS